MSEPTGRFPAVPEPTAEIHALTKTVRALKTVIELLTGQRASSGLRAVSEREAVAASIMPFHVPGYERTSLPAAKDYKRGLVFVVDGAGNQRIAYSDGFDWRYLADAGVVADAGSGDGGGSPAKDTSGGQ